MDHYPITVCDCGTQYNPIKGGKVRPCPNKGCPTHFETIPVESENFESTSSLNTEATIEEAVSEPSPNPETVDEIAKDE